MMLAYKDGAKDYHDYKIYYLAQPITMKFNHQVRIFKCTSNQRIGVDKIDTSDKVVLLNHLRNVAGSLPTTVKQVRGVFDQSGDDNTMFINFNPEMVGVFDCKGRVIGHSKLP